MRLCVSDQPHLLHDVALLIGYEAPSVSPSEFLLKANKTTRDFICERLILPRRALPGELHDPKLKFVFDDGLQDQQDARQGTILRLPGQNPF